MAVGRWICIVHVLFFSRNLYSSIIVQLMRSRELFIISTFQVRWFSRISVAYQFIADLRFENCTPVCTTNPCTPC
jgi:hypothetical protein